MTTVRSWLDAYAAEGRTGRVDIAGKTSGRIFLSEGCVGCAERNGAATMVLALADANLFSREAWEAALRAPVSERWPLIIGEDEDRRRDIVEFVRGLTTTALSALADQKGAAITFVPNVGHPFGTIATWTIEELLGPAAPEAPPLDRTEFMELLEEASPHFRGGIRPTPEPPPSPTPPEA